MPAGPPSGAIGGVRGCEMSALGLALGLALAVAPTPEVLCERTTVVPAVPGGKSATFRQIETDRSGGPGGVYGLSAVTVPPAGWEVHAVTILTTASAPGKW